MSFERDPAIVLQNEILKTREAKLNPKLPKKRGFKLNEYDYIQEFSDQDFVSEYVAFSDYYPERD